MVLASYMNGVLAANRSSADCIFVIIAWYGVIIAWYCVIIASYCVAFFARRAYPRQLSLDQNSNSGTPNIGHHVVGSFPR